MWNIGFYVCKIFDRTAAVAEPQWPEDNNPVTLASRVKLFGVIMRFRNQPLTAKQLSLKYLSLVTRSPFAEVAATLRIQLSHATDETVFEASGKTSFQLPDRWSIDSLAQDLSLNFHLAPASSGSVFCLSTPTLDDGSPLIQGSTAVVCRATTPGAPSRSGYERRRAGAARPPNLQRAAGSSRRERFDGHCDACHRYGHRASQCHYLAMFFHVREFLKNKESATVVEAAVNDWLRRNEKFLSREEKAGVRKPSGRDRPPARHPCTVALAYCDDVELHVDRMADQLDWDYFLDCSETGDNDPIIPAPADSPTSDE